LRPFRPEAALAAALLVAGCAGAGGGARPDQAELDALRAEVSALRAENQQLARTVGALAARMDAATARLARPPAEPRPADGPSPEQGTTATPAPAASSVVPEGLAVVRLGPGKARRAPAISTDVAIAEPDPGALSGLARRSGRELSAEAEAELGAARRQDGVARAHSLEDFATRYPRHPLADDALLEAAGAYAKAGREDAACRLSRRVADEYPAGDALADALWRLSTCESRGGAAEAERRLLTRLVTEFPSSAAARRAGERLAVISGRTAVDPVAADPARSGP